MSELRKPGDHPEFFRFAPPAGASRESSIRLDRDGRFWHDGELVEHQALSRSLHHWISRHPDNQRFILTNGYDWTYFTVEDAPYIVTRLSITPDMIMLHLSDDTEEALRPDRLRIGEAHAIYTTVKDGTFDAKFSRFAQTSLAPALVENESGQLALAIGETLFPLPSA